MVNREVQSMRTCNGQKDAPREECGVLKPVCVAHQLHSM